MKYLVVCVFSVFTFVLFCPFFDKNRKLAKANKANLEKEGSRSAVNKGKRKEQEIEEEKKKKKKSRRGSQSAGPNLVPDLL